MTGQLAGRIAVVTGASRGIGHATAMILAEAGADVAVCARSAVELDELVRDIEVCGVRALAVQADLTSEDDVVRLRDSVLDRFGCVDVLVNNAGIGKYIALTDMTVADYDRIMDTNMRSSFLCSWAFVPGMLERKQGWVVFINSTAGITGKRLRTAYCASKFAQMGFAQALDREVREEGIKVSVVVPGGVQTQFAIGEGRRAGDPVLDEMLSPQDIAETVLFAVTRPPSARAFMLGIEPMTGPLKL